MHDARSNRTGQPVLAADFALLPAAVIAGQRRDFTCIGCEAPAFWVKAGASGKDAYFAARGHAPDCRRAVRSDGQYGPDGDREVSQWEVDRTRVILTFPDEDSDDTGGVIGSASDRASGGRSFTGTGTPGSTRVERGPPRLLKQLVISPRFRSTDVPIQLPDGSLQPANQFFVAFQNADHERHADQMHGFWGVPGQMSRWARDNSMYVQARAGHDLSILRVNISPEIEAEFLRRFRLTSLDDLRNKYVLFIGTASVTTTGRFTLWLRNAGRAAVLDPETYPYVE